MQIHDNLREDLCQDNHPAAWAVSREVIHGKGGHGSRPHSSVNPMLCAAAVGLLYIEFPIFTATPWLELNVSDFPALLASFMFGPISGVIVNGVKVGLCLLLRGTSTGFVGDISNLVSGTLYALAAGVIYKIKKDKAGAIISLVVSGALFIASMWIFNRFVLLPLFKIPEDTYTAVLLWTALFNLVKVGVTGIITFFVYKSVHFLFNKF